MIEKMRIRNFRSIEYKLFNDIKNPLVFVGENNSGKSTVLNAIRILYDLDYIPSNNDIRHGCKSCEIIVVKSLDDSFYSKLMRLVKKSDIHKEYVDLFKSKGKRERKTNTQVFKDEFKRYVVDMVFHGKNYQKLGLKMEIARDSMDQLIVNRSFVESNFKNINIPSDEIRRYLKKAFIEKIANIDDERNFFNEVDGGSESITNSVFSLFLESIDTSKEVKLEDIMQKEVGKLSLADINLLMTDKMNTESNVFLKRINDKFCSYMDGSLQVSWDFEDTLRSRINLETQFENNKGNRIDFMSTGSGTRSLYLLSLLESYVEGENERNNRSGLFLIEEPELYLYPKLEKKMGRILKKISENNQVMITSHSSGLVTQFNEENIYVVRTEEVASGIKSKFTELENSDELVRLLGFNSHTLVGAKYVFMVEGSDDIKEYKSVIAVHYPDKIDKCKFIEVSGVRNLELSVNCQLIKNSELINNLFIITDSDGRKVKKVRDQYNNALGLSFSKDELKDILDYRIYVTEDAMNLECLSYTYDNIDFEKTPDYDEKLGNFIKKNWDDIKKNMNHQNKRKDIYTDEEKNRMEITLKNGSSEERLEVLKKNLLFKGLIRKYRNEVYLHPKISEKDKAYQKKQLKIFLERTERLFQN